ncbi:MAG: hypothetical protein L6R40_000414 [Gallowayella cf. fulva]|nr:MAG: hypothetical protein L6R40_000414 [Xanthomendoza cf. fulva]
MSSNILSYVGWTFLPNLVTGWIQSLYYGITIRAGDPKPQPGTPRHTKHRRRIHIAVIATYLLYTIYEAAYWVRVEGDFYQDLDLPVDVDEKKIKARFRRLAAIYHPDKAVNPEEHAIAEIYFVKLKTAQDTLTDATKRFAYERFGPEVLKWQHVSSIRDYLFVGLQNAAPLYGGSVMVMILLSLLGLSIRGSRNAKRFTQWRYLIFACLALVEYHTLTRPYWSPILTKVLNPFLTTFTSYPSILPFQFIALAHKATFTFFIALGQLSPLFAPQSPPSSSGMDEQQLQRLEQLAQSTDIETGRLLALEMAPLMGDEAGQNDMKGRVREWLVQNTIRADPEVRDAVGKAMQKRRVGAPAGARQPVAI